jgi:FKBP-type peptidyl-prolyl cis-trans isomerase SlyD
MKGEIHMTPVRLWLVSMALAVACSILWAPVQAENGLQVADGLKVSIEYTLKLMDNSVADSNVGQAPFSYTQGAHEIVPGLENALVGMKVGQQKRIEVQATEGYGAYNPKLRQSVEKSKVPSDAKVGSILRASDGRMVKVLEVTDKTVLLDLNHPLAGKNLIFEVKILNVEKQEQKPAPEKKP